MAEAYGSRTHPQRRRPPRNSFEDRCKPFTVVHHCSPAHDISVISVHRRPAMSSSIFRWMSYECCIGQKLVAMEERRTGTEVFAHVRGYLERGCR
jgi:hypothetical protein